MPISNADTSSSSNLNFTVLCGGVFLFVCFKMCGIAKLYLSLDLKYLLSSKCNTVVFTFWCI